MERSTDNSYIDILTDGDSEMKSCNTCVFFLQQGKGHGLCRRFPPAPHVQPTVDVSDYCGEHVDAPPKEPIVEETQQPTE